MKDIWNARYSEKEFAYGENPNAFFKQEIDKLTPGKILLPAEGEGRNAVYAAKLGWDVTAFDISDKGKEKALELAEKHNTSINYLILSIDQIDSIKDMFDVIALIYTHLPPSVRKTFHQKLHSLLNSKGKIILEGFSKEQLNFNSGGPKDYGMLFSENEIKSDFSLLSNIIISKELIQLDEGKFHKGKASVIRAVGIR